MNERKGTIAQNERISSDIFRHAKKEVHINKEEVFEVMEIPNNSKEILEKAKAFLDANGFDADFVLYIYSLGKKDGCTSSKR